MRMAQPAAMEVELEAALDHSMYMADAASSPPVAPRPPESAALVDAGLLAPTYSSCMDFEDVGWSAQSQASQSTDEDEDALGRDDTLPPLTDGSEDGDGPIDSPSSASAKEHDMPGLARPTASQPPTATPFAVSEPMTLHNPHLVQEQLGSPPPPSGADHDGHLEAARVYGIRARALLLKGTEPRPEVRDAILNNIDPDLPPVQFNQLATCLLRNYDVFALTTRELGCTSWVDFKIDTGDHPPIAQQPYRMSRVEKEAVDKAISEMKADGVVEDSTSPWVSPIVVVAKKNGQLRPCVDLRKVNAVTRDVRYPLGHNQDILDSVAPPSGEQRWHASIDMLSGYWQVPITEQAAKLRTGFASPSGQYQYRRMPMGAKGAAAVFSHLAHKMLGPLLQAPQLGASNNPLPAFPPTSAGAPDQAYPRERCVAVYLDDVILSSQSFIAHLWHICMVLDRIRYASLKASVTSLRTKTVPSRSKICVPAVKVLVPYLKYCLGLPHTGSGDL